MCEAHGVHAQSTPSTAHTEPIFYRYNDTCSYPRPLHSLTHPSYSPLMDSNSFEGSSPFSWTDNNLSTISPIFERGPIHSHALEPQLISRGHQPLSSWRRPSASRVVPRRLYYSCDDCGKTFAQQQGITRHRRTHSPNLCINCDFMWSQPYQYRQHLEQCHPDVDADLVLGKPAGSRRQTAIFTQTSDITPSVTPRLCMYCDVEWNHSSQYKDHLRECHPNVDPDAVLGEVPGSQRRHKIIARFKALVS